MAIRVGKMRVCLVGPGPTWWAGERWAQSDPSYTQPAPANSSRSGRWLAPRTEFAKYPYQEAGPGRWQGWPLVVTHQRQKGRIQHQMTTGGLYPPLEGSWGASYCIRGPEDQQRTIPQGLNGACVKYFCVYEGGGDVAFEHSISSRLCHIFRARLLFIVMLSGGRQQCMVGIEKPIVNVVQHHRWPWLLNARKRTICNDAMPRKYDYD